MKKNYKDSLPAITSILLALTASALWQYGFYPLTNWVIDLLIGLPLKISTLFSSHYVRAITNADSQFISFGLRSILIGVIIFAVMVDFDIRKLRLSRFWKYTKLILIIILFVDLAYDGNVYSKSHALLSNIDIVAPYVSDSEYKTLKSDFYQMQTIEDYNSLQNSLDSIAQSNNLQLK